MTFIVSQQLLQFKLFMRIIGHTIKNKKRIKLAPVDICESCLNCCVTEHKQINLPLCEVTGRTQPLASITIDAECPLDDYNPDHD
jgi:hypothetical protein